MSTLPTAASSGKLTDRYGVARVGQGVFCREDNLAAAIARAELLSCRGYVWDYAAKSVVHRNWIGGAT